MIALRASAQALLSWAILCSISWAQEPPKPMPPAVTPPAAAQGDELKEQTIYIPYTKLREVFEKEGRGVFLPYDKFRELWKAARENQAPGERPKPLFRSLITEATHEAVLKRDVMQVTAQLKIEAMGEGWHRIPLRLADAALTSAKLGQQNARVVHEPGQGYALLLERKKDEPTTAELTLEYAKGFDKSPGRNRVSFQPPLAAVSRWQVRIDEPGVKIEIQPLIAASDVPAEPNAKHSQLQAFVGAAETVQVEWVPRSEGAQGLTALASATVQQQVFLDEGVMRTRLDCQYTIHRAELPKLSLTTSATERVVNVFDPNVKHWNVTPAADGRQTVNVELFEPARSRQNMIVELERLGGEEAKQSLGVPQIIIGGVERQHGVIVVRVHPQLRADIAQRVGLLQIDRAELPGELTKSAWAFAFRYASSAYALTLSVEKVQPRILADELFEAELQSDRLTLYLQSLLTIERAGVFRLEYEVPANFTVRQVSGLAKQGVTAAAIESHRLEGEGQKRLIVNLARQALGRVGLVIQLNRTLSHPELDSPGPLFATVPIPVPRLATQQAERAQGGLVLYAPESLRVNPETVTGLRGVALAEALKGVDTVVPNRAALRVVQAYRYSEATPELIVQAQRRKPQISVRQFLTARVESGVVKYQSTLTYDVLYSGVKQLRLDVPQALLGKLHNDTPGIRESTITPPPDDLDEGYVAWLLEGDRELLGTVVVRLSWDLPLEKFDVGKTLEVPLAHLRPRLVDRAWGQIVISKAESIDVVEQGEPQGLRPIDPQQDLMSGAPVVSDAARAFEFHDDWQLRLSATRYELEEIKRTSIERALVRSVVSRSGQQRVEAWYRFRSAQQRLQLTLAEGAEFDIDPVRVDGRNVTLEKGREHEFFIPLGTSKGESVHLLELRYTLADRAQSFILPAFADSPAIQKVYLSVNLPEHQSVIAVDGPWSPEMRWLWQPQSGRTLRRWGYVPRSVRSESELLAWVTHGAPQPPTPRDTLVSDGRVFLFAAIDPTREAALRLSIVDGGSLQALVCALVLIGGALLIRSSCEQRLLAGGASFALFIVLGVFRPYLWYELVNDGLFAALGLVAVLWTVEYFVWRRPRATVSPPVKSPPDLAAAATVDTPTEGDHA